MVQAHTARAQALTAHEAAATKIEAAMNHAQGRGLWELDLHGLHSPEARPSHTACATPTRSNTFEGARVTERQTARGEHESRQPLGDRATHVVQTTRASTSTQQSHKSMHYLVHARRADWCIVNV